MKLLSIQFPLVASSVIRQKWNSTQRHISF